MAGNPHLIEWDNTIGDEPNDTLGRADPLHGSHYSQPGAVGDLQHGGGDAQLPTIILPQYAQGVFNVIDGSEADAVAVPPVPQMIRRRVDVPPSYQTAHESTHRRYEAPFLVTVAQAAAGTTMLVPPKMGLHYIKILGYAIALAAAGTLKFVQGSMDGLAVADMTGAFPMGGAAAPPLFVPTVEPPNPHLFTSPDQAFGIVTTTGAAAGYLMCCYSPYEA